MKRVHLKRVDVENVRSNSHLFNYKISCSDRQIHNNTQGIYTYICHSNDNKT